MILQGTKPDIGEMVLHHAADSWTWEPFYGVTVHFPAGRIFISAR